MQTKCSKCGADNQFDTAGMSHNAKFFCQNCGEIIKLDNISEEYHTTPDTPHNYNTAKMNQQLITKLFSGSSASLCFLAFVFFFLPWLRVSCSGNAFLTQSGMQIIIGDCSFDEAFEQMSQLGGSQGNMNMKTEGENISSAPALVLYPLGLLCGIIASLLFLSGSSGHKWLLFGCLGLALLTLVIHMIIGFPVQREISEQMTNSMNASQPMSTDNPFEEMGNQMVNQMAGGMVKVEYTGFFIASLVLTIFGLLDCIALLAISKSKSAEC
ncbi:MAG: hypothetical protein ABIH42_04930 [Planctomycetota bacterium]